MSACDVVILGAGMAGASLAASLAGRVRVVLVEAEAQPGRHATGRSAAMFFEAYGNADVRALTRASRAFLLTPPPGFAQTPLLHPRAAMFVADAEQAPVLDAMLADPGHAGLRRLTASDARARVPILSPDWLVAGALDESGYDIDVAALLQGYLAQARRGGVRVVTDAGAPQVVREGDGWRVSAAGDAFHAPVVVNAAGAWADAVAEAAGVAPLGLSPLRRTAVTLPAPEGCAIAGWPMVISANESFYFKPDAGQLLLSPANEDPDVAGDAAPDELDVALAVDRFETATTVEVRRVGHRWAGLRTFAPDRTPVVGYDSDAAGFFWLAGQGGYGIQTAPALSALASALILAQPLPEALGQKGVDPARLDPGRLRQKAPTA